MFLSIKKQLNSTRTKGSWFKKLAAVAAIGLGFSNPARAQYTWLDPNSGTTGTWGTATTWTGGTPVSSATAALGFDVLSGYAAYTFTNDISQPFILNSMALNNWSANTLTLAGGATGLTFSGTAPGYAMNGPGSVTVTGNISLAATTTFTGAGNGTTTLSGIISGTGGLVINQTGLGITSLTGANTFSGGVTLTNGILSLGTSATALGNAANVLTINGGDLRFTTAITMANNITDNSNLIIAGGTVSPTLSGIISGTGGLQLLNYNTTAGLTLTGANTFTGATALLPYIPPSTTITSGPTLTLSGLNGAIASSSSVTIGNGATLTLTNTAAANNNARVSATAPIYVNDGRISFTGVSSPASIQTLGNLTVSGAMGLYVSPTGTSSVLNFGTLTQVDHAPIFINSSYVGPIYSSTQYTSVFFSGGLPTYPSSGTGTQTPIVPFVAGSSYSNPSAMATYNSTNGLQLISIYNATYFTQAATSAALLAGANQNVTLAPGGVQVTYDLGGASLTVNTLNSYGYASVIQNANITVASGAMVLYDPVAWTTNSTLNFGARTGYLMGPWYQLFTGTSQITGSAGVVLAGLGGNSTIYTYTFQNTGPTGLGNPFTGGLYIDGNVVVGFNADNQLGAAGGTIAFGGGLLAYNGSASITSNRPISIDAANGGFTFNLVEGLTGYGTTATAGAATAATVLTLSGTISGVGAFTKEGVGTVNLTGSNTYSGGTVITAGTLQFSNDGNLGTGPIFLNGGILQPLTAGTSAKPVQVNASSTITSNVNFTFSSPFTTVGQLYGTTIPTITLNGTGTVSLTANSPTYSGNFTVSSGGLSITGANGAVPQVSAFTVATGASLTIDNSTAYVANRVSPFAAITLAGGSATGGSTLNLNTNSAGNNYSYGNLTVSGGTATFVNTSTLNINDGGVGTNNITFNSLTTSANNLLNIVGTTNLGNYNSTSGTHIFFQTVPSSTLLSYVYFSGFGGGGTPIYSTTYGLTLPPATIGSFIDNINSVGSGSPTSTLAYFSTNAATTADLGATINTLNMNQNVTLVTGVNAPSSSGGANGVGNGSAPLNTLILTVGSLSSTTNTLMTSSTPAVVQFGPTGTTLAAFNLSGGTLTFDTLVTPTTTGGLTATGTGSLTFNGPNAITGLYTINTLGTVTLNTASTTSGLAGTTAGSTLALGAPLSINGAATATFAGSITGSGALSTAAANTGVETLTGTNTGYTGSITLNGGTLVAGSASAFGPATNAAITVNSGASVALTGGITLNALPMTLNGIGATGRTGALDNIAGTDTYNGAINLGSATQIGATAGTLNLGGTITTNSGGVTFNPASGATVNISSTGTITGTGSLTKIGAGTLTLTGASNYTGTTSVNVGTLTLGASNVLPTGSALTINSVAGTSGMQFNMAGFNQTLTGITIYAPTAATTVLAIGAGELTLTGGITISNNTSGAGTGYGSTFSSATGGLLDLGGAIRNITIAGQSNAATSALSLGVVVQDGGINFTGNPSTASGNAATGMTLSAATANTYALGTVVNAGTLNVASTTTLGTGALTFNQTGTVLSSVVVNSSMTLNGLVTGTIATPTDVVLSIAGTGSVLTLNQSTTTTFPGNITGVGGLTLTGGGTLNLTGINTNTGPTTVIPGTSSSSTLTFSGVGSGTSLTAGALTIGNGSSQTGIVTFNNSGGNTSSTAPHNRYNPASAVNLNNGILNLSGDPTNGSTVTMGALTITGGLLNTINLTPNGQPVTLTFSSLATIPNGDLLTFTGTGLGAATLSGSVSRILFTTAPTLIGGVIPNANYVSGSTTGQATYDPTRGVILAVITSGSWIDNINNVGTGSPTPTTTIFNTTAATTANLGATINSLTMNNNVTLVPGVNAPSTTGGANGLGNASAPINTLVLAAGSLTSTASSLLMTSSAPAVLQFGSTGTSAASIALIGGDVIFDTQVTPTTTGGLTTTGSGNLTFNGPNAITGLYTIGNTANVTLNTAATATGLTGTTGTLVVNAPLTITGSASLTYSGSIAGTSSITFAATTFTGVETFSGPGSAFTGTINVNGGSLIAASAGAFGGASATVNVASGTSASLTGGITLNPVSMTLNGTGFTGRAGALDNITGTNTYNGNITLGSATQIGSTAGTLNLGGTISMGSNGLTFNAVGAINLTSTGSITGSGNLTKLNTGLVTLTGASSYTGTTTISANVLAIGANNALPVTTALTVGTPLEDTTCQFNMGTFNQTIASLTIPARGSGAVASVIGTGTLTVNGAISYVDGTTNQGDAFEGTISVSTLNLGGAIQNITVAGQNNGVSPGDFTISSVITNGGVNISANPSSTNSAVTGITLSGANTYTLGTTLNVGTLNATSSIGTGPLTINQSGTLASAVIFGSATTIGSLSTGTVAVPADATVALGGLLTINQTTSTSFVGVISGAYGITVTGGGSLHLTGTNSYTGATTVTPSSTASTTLTFSGVGSGSALSGGALTIGNGSSNTAALTFDNSGGNISATAPQNRYSATAAVTLNNGVINLLGDPTIGSTVTMGALTVSGGLLNAINLTTNGFPVKLTFTSLAAIPSGDNLTFSGTNLGATLTGNASGIFFTTAPTLVGGVIPNSTYVSGSTTGSASYSTTYGVILATVVGGSFIDNINNVGSGSPTPTSAVFSTTAATTANLGATILSLTMNNNVTLVTGVNAPSTTGGANGLGNANAPLNTFVISSGSITSTTSVLMTSSTPAVVEFGSTGTTNAGFTLTAGTLTFDTQVTPTTTGGLTTSGAGSLVFNGPNAITGLYTIGNTGTVSLNTATTASGLSGTTGTVALGATFSLSGAATATYSGLITGSTPITTLAANTGVQTLSGANTGYTGSITINGGSLVAGNASAFGPATNSALTVNSGGSVGLTGGITLNTLPMTLNGTGATGRAGAFDNISGVNTYNGTITLGSATQIGATAGTLNLGGTITTVSGGVSFDPSVAAAIINLTSTGTVGGPGGLTKIGAGTTTLTGISTYSGATAVNAGTLTLGATNAIPITSAMTIDSIAGSSAMQFNLAGFNQTLPGITIYAPTAATTVVAIGAGKLTLTGGITISNSTTGAGTGYGSTFSSTTGGLLDLNGAIQNITIAGQSNAALSALSLGVVVQDGGINFTGNPSTASGNAATGMTLAATVANTYALGTTVNAGTLTVASTTTLGTGALTFNQAGTVLSAVVLNSAMTINGLSSGTVAVPADVNVTLGGLLTINQSTSTNYAGGFSGAYGITLTGGGSLNVTGTSTYTGATTVTSGTSVGTTLTFSGVGHGSALTAGALTIGNGATTAATVTFNNSGGDINTTSPQNRYNPASAVSLNNGVINLLGDPTNGSVVTMGALTVAGGTLNAINLTPNGQPVTITFSSLASIPSGDVLIFNGTGLGAPTLSGSVSRILFTTAPTLVGNIIPNAEFEISAGNFATASYDSVRGVVLYVTATGSWIDNINNVGTGSPTSTAAAYTTNAATTANLGATILSLTMNQNVTLVTGVNAPSSTGGANGLGNQSAPLNSLVLTSGSLTSTTTNLITSSSPAVVQFGSAGTTNANIALTGTLTFDTQVTPTTTGGLTTSGTGSLVFNGPNAITGLYTIGNTGTVSLNTATTASGLTGTTGTVALGAMLSINGSATTTYSGLISGSSPITLISGYTGAQTLSGADTGFTGTITVNAGSLIAGNASAFGPATNSALTVASGASVSLTGGITLNALPMTLNGTGATGRAGALDNISGVNTYNGAISLPSATQIGATAGTLNLGGAITTTSAGVTFNPSIAAAIIDVTSTGSIGGPGGVTKIGAGTLTIAGASTYSGTTAINAGTLSLGASNALPATSAMTIDTAAGSSAMQFNLAGFSQTVAGINIYAPTAATTVVAIGAGTLTLNGGITIANNTTGAGTGYASTFSSTTGGLLDLGGTIRNITIAGQTNAATSALSLGVVIQDGGINFTGNPSTSNGAATGMTLSATAANTYALGTTVNAGTLTVAATTTLGTGGLTMNQSGTVLSAVVLNSAMTLTGLSMGTVATPADVTLTMGGLLTMNQASTTTFGGTIAGAYGIAMTGGGILNLTGTNTFTGALTISKGTIGVTTLAAPGTASGAGAAASTVAFSLGGTGTTGILAYNGTSPFTYSRNFTLVAGGSGGFGGSGALTVSGVISGSGNLIYSGTSVGTTSLTSANTFTGGISVIGGTLTLSGTTGTANASANVSISGGGSLVLDNTLGAVQRLNTTTPPNLTFNSGQLTIIGNSTTNLSGNTELFGILNVTGGTSSSNILTLADSGPPLQITFSSLNVTSGASLLIRGDSLGAPASSGNYTRVLFTTAPVATGVPITGVYFDQSSYGTGLGQATYDPTLGIILYNAPTTTGNVLDNIGAPMVPTTNTFVTGGTGNTLTVNAGATVNSLTIQSEFTTVNFSNLYTAQSGNANAPSGTLVITSGLVQVLNTAANVTVNGATGGSTLQTAGAWTFNLNTNLTLASNMTITGGGLSTLGTGNLTINGTNNITGNYILNGGNLTIASTATLTANTVSINATSGTTLLTLGGGLNANSLTFGSNSTSSGANIPGNATIGGAINLAGSANTLSVGGTTSAASLTLAGASGAILTGNATFTGAINLAGTANTLNVGGTTSATTLSMSGTSSATLTGNATLSGGITLSGTNNLLTMGGTLSTSSITMSGAGNASVAGTATITGAINMTGSNNNLTLTSGGTAASLAGQYSNTLILGGNLTLTGTASTEFDGAINGTTGTNGSITKPTTSTGTLTLTGANSFGGGFTVNGGAVTTTQGAGVGTGVLTLTGTTLNYTGTVANDILNPSSIVLGGTGTATLNVSNATTTLAYYGNITGTGGLNKTGPGTLVLNGTGSTYTGSTSIADLGGVIQLGANNALPVGTNLTITLTSSLAGFQTGLNLGNYNQTIGTLTLAMPTGAAVTGSTAITGSGTLTIGGTITNGPVSSGDYPSQIGVNVDLGGATRTIITGSGSNSGEYQGDLQFFGVISGSNGAGLIINNGTATAGIVTFENANTYTGSTTLVSGIIYILSNNGIPSTSAFIQSSGTTLDLTGGGLVATSTGLGSLTGTGSIILGSGSVLTIGGDNTSPAAYSGVISGTGGSLVKVGTGTLTLTGANSYTGTTTVNSGALLIGTGGSLPAGSAVTVNGGTLGGTGTIAGTVTVNGGATLSGGIAGVGTLTLSGSAVSINSGATIGVAISNGAHPSTTPGGSTVGTIPNPTSNNFISVTTAGANTYIDPGTLITITSTYSTFSNSSSYSYEVAKVTGLNLSTLSLTNQSQFTAIGFAAFNFSVTGDASGDIFLNFTTTPEPSTILLLVGSAAGVFGYVRRRRGQKAIAI